MYCSRCGKAVRDDDNFCNNCGYRLRPADGYGALAADVENPSFDSGGGTPSSQKEPKKVIDTSEFVWDVHDFDRPAKKIEDVVVDWKTGKLTETLKGEISGEGSETQEVPQKEVLTNAVFDDNEHIKEITQFETSGLTEYEEASRTRETEQPVSEEVTDIKEPVTIEDIERELGEAKSVYSAERREDTARINQFYTFNQKNAEFQKLLDKEYERLAKSSAGAIPKGLLLPTQEEALESVQEAPRAENTATYQGTKAQSQPVAEEIFREKDIFENKEIIKKFGSLELDPEKAALFDEFFLGETVAEARPEEQEQQLLKAAETEIQDLQETCSPNEVTAQEILSYEGKNQPAADATKTPETETIEAHTTIKAVSPTEDQLISEEQILEEAVVEKTPILSEESIEARPTESAERLICEEKQDVKLAAMEQFLDGEPVAEQPPSDMEETKRGGKAWKVIFTIVVIILLVEAALLGIKNFAPDSEAAKFIDEKTGAVVTYMMDLLNKNDVDQDEEADKPAENEEPAMSTLPAEDKEALINSQLVHNKNIQSIYANDDLKYSSTTEYGAEAIAKSASISDNLLYTDDSGEPVYKDQAAVAAVIAFDSQWIDYVNDKDETVFDRLIVDSVAYDNCKAYRKAGKITENFLALEIGEIREAAEGYFIWTREKIEIIENGVKKTGTYNWIYHLEPADGELKIVNYYKY